MDMKFLNIVMVFAVIAALVFGNLDAVCPKPCGVRRHRTMQPSYDSQPYSGGYDSRRACGYYGYPRWRPWGSPQAQVDYDPNFSGGYGRTSSGKYWGY